MSNEFEPNQETTPLVRRTLKQYARIVSLYSENLICLDDSRQSAKAFIENHLVQIIPSKSTRPNQPVQDESKMVKSEPSVFPSLLTSPTIDPQPPRRIAMSMPLTKVSWLRSAGTNGGVQLRAET